MELFCPTTVEVNLSALERNLHALRASVKPAQVLGVLKANAYGHGLVQCGVFLQQLNIDYIGVARAEEGVLLRKAGVTSPILVFGGLSGAQLDLFFDFGLELTVSSLDKLQVVEAHAQQRNKVARIHLKIDCGMGRIGVRPDTASQLITRAFESKSITVVGVYSHFSHSEAADMSITSNQLKLFLESVAGIGGRSCLRHVANSAALLYDPVTHLEMVRPGLALYGIPPCDALSTRFSFSPVMSFKSRVVYFKVVAPGRGISYGHTWSAQRQTRVVTVSAGYGDGYLRRLSNRGEVLIRGRRYPVVGTVCMDQFMVDIGEGEAFNGDEVVLFGSQGRETISAGEIAKLTDTIPHEVLCAIQDRVPRYYHFDGRKAQL